MIRCCSRFRIETVSNESSVLLLVVVVMERITLLCLLSSWFGASSAQETRNVNVPEGGDALLSCGLDSLQSINEFDWRKDNGDKEKMEVFEYVRGSYPGKGQEEQFKNRVEFFQPELNSGNASIKIKDARLEDNGTYICGLGLFKEHRQEVKIRLNVGGVLKFRNITGAARVPYIHTIEDEITWRLLECRARGVPPPSLEWRNSAGKTLVKHNPENEDVKLQVKVTKSDTYICVVTQNDIYHQINNTRKVNLPEQSTSKIVIIAVTITSVILLSVFGVIIAVLGVKFHSLKENTLRPESKVARDITSY